MCSGAFAYVPGGEGRLGSNRGEPTRFANGMVVRVCFNQHHISVLNEHAPRTALALMYSLTSRTRPHEDFLQAADAEREHFPTDMPFTKRYLQRTRGWLRNNNPG